MRAGCDGYILKGINGPELVRVVRVIHKGESYVSPNLAAFLFAKSHASNRSSPRKIEPLETLSYREERILELVARGLSNKEVAEKLTLSEKTVKHYMTAILRKLQVRNRVEATLVAQSRSQKDKPN